MLCTNYTLFSPVFLGIFTLFSADTKYGYDVGMRANLLHYLHLLDQVVHFLLRAVLLNKRTFTRLSFHTWDQTCKWCLTMLYNTMPHLKFVSLQNLHWWPVWWAKMHQPAIEDLCNKHSHFQWRQTQLTCLLESLLPSYAAVLRYRVSW